MCIRDRVYDGIGRAKIKDGVKKIAAGELDYKVPTEGMFSSQKEVAEDVYKRQVCTV